MKKIAKWEEKYNNYNKEEVDKKIEELEAKINDNSITKEKYNELKSELKKEKKIRNNVDKVKNLLELRDKLSQSKEEIQTELKRIETLTNAKKESIKIELELGKINEERTRVNAELKLFKAKKEELNNKLKNPTLKDDEREELNNQLQKLTEAEKNKKEKLETIQQENDKKYLDNQKLLAENKDGNNKFAGKAVEELKKEAFKIGTKISKINMVANNLMQGKSWDEIEISLDNWKDRKYTSKEKVTELAKDDDSKSKEDIKDVNKKDEAIHVKKEEIEEVLVKKRDEETSLVEQSEFSRKHPRLAKIANGFLSLKDKIVDKFKKEKQEEKTEVKPESEAKKVDEVKEDKNIAEENDFKKYLKEVAEKGLEKTTLERKFGEEKAKDILEARKKREERMAKGGFKAVDSKAKNGRVYKGEDR